MERVPPQPHPVKLRYFVGKTNAGAAQAFGLSKRTVKNYRNHARAWLYTVIKTVQTSR
jgi:hypothetical protein